MGVALTNGNPSSTEYSSGHLTFRRDRIEPLASEDTFEVSTPAGRFRMTRAEFHENFPEVVASASYRDRGEYHYPMIPYKAFRFLIREDRQNAAPAPSVPADEQAVGEVDNGPE